MKINYRWIVFFLLHGMAYCLSACETVHETEETKRQFPLVLPELEYIDDQVDENPAGNATSDSLKVE